MKQPALCHGQGAFFTERERRKAVVSSGLRWCFWHDARIELRLPLLVKSFDQLEDVGRTRGAWPESSLHARAQDRL
jgi:hypothetical protein